MTATFDKNTPNTLECGLTAFAAVQVPRPQIQAMRRQPHPAVSLSPGLLKYAEEQTVVSLSAVYHAIHNFGLQNQNFTDWGVVAGPRFLGRETCAQAIDKYYRLGALSMSPLVVPYISLHAVSGAISLLLKMNGPNLGICGAHGGIVQTLLAGLTMQREHHLPGIWMVVSAWDPEPIPDEAGKGSPTDECRAVAMAFTEVSTGWQGLRLRLTPEPARIAVHSLEPSLAELTDFLHGCANLDASSTKAWQCSLNWGVRLELTTKCQGMVIDPFDTLARPGLAA